MGSGEKSKRPAKKKKTDLVKGRYRKRIEKGKYKEMGLGGECQEPKKKGRLATTKTVRKYRGKKRKRENDKNLTKESLKKGGP